MPKMPNVGRNEAIYGSYITFKSFTIVFDYVSFSSYNKRLDDFSR